MIAGGDIDNLPIPRNPAVRAGNRGQPRCAGNLTPYSGLGGTAYYFTFSEAGINAQGLSVFNGTHGFGAAVENNKLSQAKLAQLTKLAASL